MTERLQKITFGEMRDSGVHGVLVHCSDYTIAARQHDGSAGLAEV
jgi:hypothetical protein